MIVLVTGATAGFGLAIAIRPHTDFDWWPKPIRPN
jgi:hypothetical protein